MDLIDSICKATFKGKQNTLFTADLAYISTQFIFSYVD